MNELYISTIRPLDDQTLYDRFYALISSQRKETIDRFKGIDDKKRSIVAELLILKALDDHGYKTDDLIYEYGPYGKPALRDFPDFFFSISHSKDYVVLAMSDKQVGCDIEKIRKYDMKVAERFFTEEEYCNLSKTENEEDRKKLFFRYWTMKESYIKYTGEGLHCPLDSFVIEKDTEDSTVIYTENQKLYLTEISVIDGYCISICSPDRRYTIKNYEI